MPEQTELSFVGDWRITVSGRGAGWSQRVVASNTAAGTQILNGVPGMSMDVYGNGQAPWTLRIQHNDGSSGWQPNWLRSIASIAGTRLTWGVSSEDVTTGSSDRDFNDLVINLAKLGLASQPIPPFAILPQTMQAMPEGIFEATLGRYFMAVRVTNIWTLTWPAGARVGLSDRCRAWLAAAGVIVIVVDAWSTEDEEAFGQRVIGGRVVVGALPAWESRLIYFKVDVSAAATRKHKVEVQVYDRGGSRLDRSHRIGCAGSLPMGAADGARARGRRPDAAGARPPGSGHSLPALPRAAVGVQDVVAGDARDDGRRNVRLYHR